MANLALLGVPLSVAPVIHEVDTKSHAFALAQQAFQTARGEGTPLLPVPVTSRDPGPAAYIRNALTAMLMRHAAGDDPRPIGNEELSAVAEAHLALIETIAVDAGNYKPAPPAPTFPSTLPPTRFAALEDQRPDWLSDVYLRSLVRVSGILPPRSTAPVQSVTSSPLVRLATESAHWRGTPAHGTIQKTLAEKRATAMSAVVSSPRMYVPPLTATAPVVEGGEADVDWLNTAIHRFSGATISSLSANVPGFSDDDTRLSVLRKMNDSEKTTDSTTERARVIDASTVIPFLSEFDVMRSYDYQSV